MDRDRLKDVHQTDLTESRVNEDFLEWLKTKGPSWLLIILVAIIAYLAVLRFRTRKLEYQNNAWAEFYQCALPGAFEDVAEKYSDLKGLALLARLRAADMHLTTVQTGRELNAAIVTGGDETSPPEEQVPEPLTADRRVELLAVAERLYTEVLDGDDDSLSLTLLTVNAMSGMAAVAESRNDVETARTWYEKAASRADGYDDGLATRMRSRLDSIADATVIDELPSVERIREMRAASPARPKTPVEIDASISELILTDPVADQ